MLIGVLALQGAFREHQKMLADCGVESVQVRKPEQLFDIDGLIIPGGESTTIGKLLTQFSLFEPLINRAKNGMPVFGTCAGLIMLAKDIKNSDQPRLGLMDVVAERNAYGRQVDSFEAELSIECLGSEPIRAVFIRAPYIEQAGEGVEVLAVHGEKIVLARQGNYLVAAFHPELTEDTRLHQYFIDIVRRKQ